MHQLKPQKASRPDELVPCRLDAPHLPGWGAALRTACGTGCGRVICPGKDPATAASGWNCGTAACRGLEIPARD